MKGLLIKDLYMIWRHWKVMIVFQVVYALIAAFSDMGLWFAFINIFLGTMVVKSLMAYEEQSKWECLAVHLPVTAGQIVMEKYMIGFGAAIFTAFLTAGIMFLADIFQNGEKGMAMLPNLILLTAVGMLVLAVELPVIFKYGVTKGRGIFIAVVTLVGMLIGGVNGAVGSMEGREMWELDGTIKVGFVLLELLVAVIAVLASMKLSVHFYQKREF